MEYFGWTPTREVWVEPDPRVSIALGAVGVVIALVGLLLAEPDRGSVEAEAHAAMLGAPAIVLEEREARDFE